tara:strand:+ start:72445 stop:73989 length:1545 start_codon:yes stop_codon:yes gene_type:complete
MLFNSYEFLVFLPVCVGGYLALTRSRWDGAGMTWLLLASAIFYTWWKPADLFVLASSVVVNFRLGQMISRDRSRSLLAIGIALNLGLLGYFKYTGFLLGTLGLADHDFAQIALPLGISFFTFQQIAYLVDAYRGEGSHAPLKHYALFVSFFPQLIAGPIVHHKELLPQFSSAWQSKRNRWNDIAIGFSIFAIGLFKKAVLADRIAPYVQDAFGAVESGADPSLIFAWQAVIGYGLQLYFDFSGYCDMAIGAARMLGIELPVNFASPYKSRNISEFWRRWHITLSQFLRDYLYFPLGGSRHGTPRTLRNLMITMALGGLWHGAGWNFVVWGILHGMFLCVAHAWGMARNRIDPERKIEKTVAYSFAASGLTFLCVSMAWAFFRAESSAAAMRLVNGLFGFNGVDIPIALHRKAADMGLGFETFGIAASDAGTTMFVSFSAWILVLLGIVWCLPNTSEIAGLSDAVVATQISNARRTPRNRFAWAPNRRWAMMSGLLLAIGILSLPEVSVFLYFQF